MTAKLNIGELQGRLSSREQELSEQKQRFAAQAEATKVLELKCVEIPFLQRQIELLNTQVEAAISRNSDVQRNQQEIMLAALQQHHQHQLPPPPRYMSPFETPLPYSVPGLPAYHHPAAPDLQRFGASSTQPQQNRLLELLPTSDVISYHRQQGSAGHPIQPAPQQQGSTGMFLTLDQIQRLTGGVFSHHK